MHSEVLNLIPFYYTFTPINFRYVLEALLVLCLGEQLEETLFAYVFLGKHFTFVEKFMKFP